MAAWRAIPKRGYDAIVWQTAYPPCIDSLRIMDVERRGENIQSPSYPDTRDGTKRDRVTFFQEAE
jgi:hypothetical protein